MIRKHFRLKRIALGLAFAAVAVPTAQAKPIESSTPAPQPIASEISVQSGVPQLQVEGLRWTATPAVAHQPIASEISVQSPAFRLTVVPNPVVSTTGSDGFNWSDAGIGASVSFGLALLLLTAVGLGRRYRSRGLAI
jgi:hypothetical protein